MTDPKIDSRYIEDKLTGITPLDRFKQLSFSRLSTKILTEFRNLSDPTPTISDALDQLGIRGAIPASTLNPVIDGKVVAGQVITIKYIPEVIQTSKAHYEHRKARLGDRDAYAVAQPGDIAVMDNSGRKNISTIGGLSVTCAKKYNLSACIVDGGIRDVGLIRQLKFPVWSRGRTPISGKFRIETIEINGPVECSGVRVNCGDLAVADENGVTFIPFHLVEKVLNLVQKAEASEGELIKALNDGKSMAQLREILPPEKW